MYTHPRNIMQKQKLPEFVGYIEKYVSFNASTYKTFVNYLWSHDKQNQHFDQNISFFFKWEAMIKVFFLIFSLKRSRFSQFLDNYVENSRNLI